MTRLIRKKIVILGAFGVGKTSLVRRFVSNEFSEEYISTLGVRIEKRVVDLPETSVELLIWDIAGEDEFFRLRKSYLRGAAGCVYVLDATRSETVTKIAEFREECAEALGDIPTRIVINKSDLPCDARLPGALTDAKINSSISTSAMTGENVSSMFADLASEISPQ